MSAETYKDFVSALQAFHTENISELYEALAEDEENAVGERHDATKEDDNSEA